MWSEDDPLGFTLVPLNNSQKLLKWPQTQTYKLLIASTMIVYNGKLELCINDKAFIFFWNHFQLAECEAFSETGFACWSWKLRICKPCHACYTTFVDCIKVQKNTFIHLFIRAVVIRYNVSKFFIISIQPKTKCIKISMLPRVFVFMQVYTGLAMGVENSCRLSETFEDE